VADGGARRVRMDDEARARFSEFVAARTPSLIRLAYLLTGDQHAAEDLLQTALARTAARWSRLRHEDPEAYVRTVLYREQVSFWRRRGRRREVTTPVPPDHGYADPTPGADLRLSMREALLRLPADQRAVLVLRYYEDLTETQVAAILDCSVGTVRSRTHRAVTRLRALLPEASDLVIQETP
jgi:RNA polymerase sigma-70 factor (sigma-E family)